MTQLFFTSNSLAYIRKTHWYTLNQDAHITVIRYHDKINSTQKKIDTTIFDAPIVSRCERSAFSSHSVISINVH